MIIRRSFLTSVRLYPGTYIWNCGRTCFPTLVGTYRLPVPTLSSASTASP